MRERGDGYVVITKEDYNKLVKEGAIVVEDADEFFENEGESSQEGVIIKFGPNANPSVVSDYSKKTLKNIGKSSGNKLIYITSTSRDAKAQARAMYNNLERDLALQRKKYLPFGQLVIDVYVELKKQGASAAEIQAAMTSKINELGPANVSKHAADPNLLNTMDISIRRLANPSGFRKTIGAYPNIRLLNENGVFHIEIKQLKSIKQ